MPNLIQITKSNELYTTSLLVADKFKKRHKNVIQRIEKLSKVVFSRLKIKPSDYIDERGKIQKIYLLNHDACAFITMGFTGKQADEWKLDYIDAFNKMERIIKRQLKKEWKELRKETATEYKLMCETLVEVRKLSGKETKSHHFINEAKLVNFAITGEYKKLNREGLSEDELHILKVLEMKNTVLFSVGLTRDDRRKSLVNLFREMTMALIENKEMNHA